MSDNLNLSDFSKPIYLHFNFEKFWEIKLDPMTHKANIRCGKLESDGKEDPSSIQAIEKANASWGEAVLYAEKHIKMKLAKGYDFLNKSGQQSVPKITFTLAVPNNDTLDVLSDYSRGSIAPSEISLGSKRKQSDMVPRDDSKQIKKSNGQGDLVEEDSLESVLKSLEAQEKFQSDQKSLGDFTQKAYRIENLKSDEKPIITEKGESLELILEFGENKVLVSGFQKRIDQFVDYLKRFLAQRKKTGNDSKNGDSGKKEIPVSQAAKLAPYIEQKGLDLGLICEVHEKSVIVLGDASKIAELEKYIKEKEKDMLKSPQKPAEDDTVNKEVPLTPSMKRMRAEIEKKSDQLGVFCEFTDAKLIMLGKHSAIAELLGYLFELEASPSKDKPEKNGNGEGDGDYTQKEIKLSKAITNHMPEIKKKAEELDLILDIEGEKFLVAGFEKKINELKKLIEEKEKEKPKTEEATKSLALSKGSGSGDYIQKEINISTFHRARQEEIEKKAEEMELICDFGYDVVLLTGPTSSIGMFIAYLYEVESGAKKALYPKYWDFHEVSAFSMANIPQTSQEYKEVEQLFFQTMRGHTVLKLERIQNKYLMDHYVNNIQKRLELRPKDLNRMLLFHGTRGTAPETIYKNFDTGFDLQYAAHGAYGKGIYFAVAASYSHGGFVYRTSRNTFQLIVADVFVGKPKNSGGGNFIKAPEGYDCICGNNGGFYILYNNFHSYPLYLLEYR